MIWPPQQEAALKAVARWLNRGEPQIFRLFGYAGTGKTTLAKKIAGDVEGEVAFGAFTGKAALVLRAKGCAEARTIHSLIYRATETETGEPSFVLNEDSTVARSKLVIIDECSMVDAELGRDLLCFGVPILVLGDPGQLPPVKGGGFFTGTDPDVMLTEVHRQAEDNPILHLSMLAREGKRLSPGAYGESRVIKRTELDEAIVMQASQLLTGLNRTRRSYNLRMRALLGRATAFPEAGDKLVCLKNNHKKGLLNGGLWLVKSTAPARKKKLVMDIISEDDAAERPRRISVLPEFFQGLEDTLAPPMRKDSDEFDYGYALTVHKAQGSQWDNVILFDESFAFREHRARWLYTGITRAANHLTIVI
jgi:exodeoxyribonuclease-5